jgi:hypothetical protein
MSSGLIKTTKFTYLILKIHLNFQKALNPLFLMVRVMHSLYFLVYGNAKWNTFDAKCINRLIHKYHNGNVLVLTHLLIKS